VGLVLYSSLGHEHFTLNLNPIEIYFFLSEQPIIQRNISKKAVQNQVVKPVNVELQVYSKNVQLNVCCTGIKVSGTKSNFLRVYYADLATPILGDHLYSARVKSVGGFMTALNPLSVRVGAEHQVSFCS